MGKRPPIELVCPNGEIWCFDRKSSNGSGWQVTGEWPNITCQPWFTAGDYHGWLRNGEFAPDLDGKSWPVPSIGADCGRPATIQNGLCNTPKCLPPLPTTTGVVQDRPHQIAWGRY